ncbi:alpha/beta fold hydrolase [Paramicrobacterium agarici]|uniref:alpha/beta fold hydrolase n=1 Tax=Paramicrobacterium agarici TaxID=630514 RepID=UPI001154D94B|nr:alpha/beta fold hydrolase [Microbacterium agarici]
MTSRRFAGALGIDEWTILGHSAGGGYALDYALSHPDSVSGLILDCPCLDADATDRFRLPRAAALLQDVGKTSEAEKCVALAASPRRLTGGDRSWEVMQALGDRYLDLFVAGREGRARYERLIGRAPEDLDWAKGVSHLPLLHDMYRDRTPSLSSLSVPSVLLHGEGDLVAAPSVIEANRAATGGDVVTIPNAGHFSYIEQPRAYVEAVAGFMNAPKCRAA